MPKPVVSMTADEIRSEIASVQKQITAGKVGTPNVYVRLAALENELHRRIGTDKWMKVDEALRIVDKAMDRTEFGKWIDANRDTLDCKYDDYKSSCTKTLEEPDGFYYWALGRFIQELLIQEKLPKSNAKAPPKAKRLNYGRMDTRQVLLMVGERFEQWREAYKEAYGHYPKIKLKDLTDAKATDK